MKSNIIFLIILVLISVIGISVSSIIFNKEVLTNTNELRAITLEPTFDDTVIKEMEQRDAILWGTTSTNMTENQNDSGI